MPSPVGELLPALARAMAEARVEWYLFGAQAAILHGAARLTADVDVTIRLHPATLDSLVQALERHGFGLRTRDQDLIERTRVVPLCAPNTRDARRAASRSGASSRISSSRFSGRRQEFEAIDNQAAGSNR